MPQNTAPNEQSPASITETGSQLQANPPEAMDTPAPLAETSPQPLATDVSEPEVTMPTAVIAKVQESRRKRYHAKVILVESERTVGTQTFKHIRLEDGAEHDLTDEEYQLEVQ